MNLVIRCNYGDESIALLQWLHENKAIQAKFSKVYVCYINTGWSAGNWQARVLQGEHFCHSVGFTPIILEAPETFQELCLARGSFPSQKFQWCAGFLKGVPFLEWIDAQDPACEWMVAIPKRQALYRQFIPEYLEQCEYHGERQVWHPMVSLGLADRDRLIQAADFSILQHQSQECAPCVNGSAKEFRFLAESEVQKVSALESKLRQNFVQYYKPFSERVEKIKVQTLAKKSSMDNFSKGCGDPFGCGL